MKQALLRIQMAFVIITICLLFNFVVETIFEAIDVKYNINYALAISAVTLLITSFLAKLNVWK